MGSVLFGVKEEEDEAEVRWLSKMKREEVCMVEG